MLQGPGVGGFRARVWCDGLTAFEVSCSQAWESGNTSFKKQHAKTLAPKPRDTKLLLAKGAYGALCRPTGMAWRGDT